MHTSGGSAGITQGERHTELFSVIDFLPYLSPCMHMPLFMSREGFSHPFPSSTVKPIFLYLRPGSLSTAGCWIKIPGRQNIYVCTGNVKSTVPHYNMKYLA